MQVFQMEQFSTYDIGRSSPLPAAPLPAGLPEAFTCSYSNIQDTAEMSAFKSAKRAGDVDSS